MKDLYTLARLSLVLRFGVVITCTSRTLPGCEPVTTSLSQASEVVQRLMCYEPCSAIQGPGGPSYAPSKLYLKVPEVGLGAGAEGVPGRAQ